MRYAANDLEAFWLPFTSNRDFKQNPRLLVSGSGVRYRSHKGHEILDASSGLFCSPAGHGRQEIADAVQKSLSDLSYCPSFQHSHPGAFELSRKVAQLAPEDMDYVFYGNSGSEAVESALKIALLYHRIRGQGQRMRIVGRERGYHGVNFAGFSVGGMVRNRESFGLGLPGVTHMRHTHLPELNRFSRGQPEHGADLADDLQRQVELHGGDTIAACIVEPVAGSTGCLPPPKGYLERLRAICDKHGILLIFDEVITGFGRLGRNFGADRFGVKPDMMTMAKAITNGTIPMSAVSVGNHVYKSITEAAPDRAIEFFHGYTWSANPAACAAGIAALDIYEKEGLFANVAALEDYFLDTVFAMKDIPIVTDIRGIGLLATIDLAADAEGVGKRGYKAIQAFYDAGLLLKITGDAAILAPAFVYTKDLIDEMADKLRGVLKTL